VASRVSRGRPWCRVSWAQCIEIVFDTLSRATYILNVGVDGCRWVWVRRTTSLAVLREVADEGNFRGVERLGVGAVPRTSRIT